MDNTRLLMLTHDGLHRLVELYLHRTVNLIAMRPFTEKQLCSPLDPGIRYTPFFYGLLPGDRRVFSLRPFCIPLDLPIIYNWLQEYCSVPGKNPFAPVQQLLEAYHDLLTADYSQSLVAEIDGMPILQIDIIRADQDEISLKENIQTGDYCIHFLFSPHFDEPMEYFASALNSCLYSFFSFPGIRRVFCKAAVCDKRSNRLLQGAGFVLNKTVKDYPGTSVNIYRHDYVPTVTG
ncbi:MAG: GNAT family N-acetyltransferase [Niastella sp.]|nr:GNAT family N-acetyltransferase [Niastella sp.]